MNAWKSLARQTQLLRFSANWSHARYLAQVSLNVRWLLTSSHTVRIYADFNGLVQGPKNPERTAVVLDTFGSLRDLANAGVLLHEGLDLIVVDWSDENEDLKGQGTAQYDRENRWWVVEFDERGVRNVPAGDRSPVGEFQCVQCREPLGISSPSEAFDPGASCPACGTRVAVPFDPPDA